MQNFILICLLSIGFISFNPFPAYSEEFSPSQQQEAFYIEADAIKPGQVRYADYQVMEKVKESVENGEVAWNETEKRWELKHHHSSSLFPLSKSLPVVNGPYGFVLVDGHHHFLENQKLGGTTIPVKVIADYSRLSLEEFLNIAEEKGFIHPYDVYGNRVHLPLSFSELQNDPNRFFAALGKRIYIDTPEMHFSKGSEYPIWVKVGKDIPFIEMRISEAMWNAGLVYDEQQGTEPDAVFYETARDVIKAAEIKGLRVIPTRMHYSEFDIDSL
ncbi:MAG: hypothetical protein Tsb0021_14350 [Chlamydiales bacterium]